MKKEANSVVEEDINIERLRNIRRTLENLYPPQQVKDWIAKKSPIQMAHERKKPVSETNQSVKEMLKTIVREMGA